MSKADAAARVPDEGRALHLPYWPGLGRLLRLALVDFYFHSLGLIGANAVFGAGLALVLGLTLLWTPAWLGASILLGLPGIGMARMAAVIARGESPGLADLVDGMRRRGAAAVGWAATLGLATLVLGVNVAAGFGRGGFLGWSLGVLAAWGLVAAWAWTLALWPLLADPLREDLGLVALARLAALTVLVRPGRSLEVAAVVAVLAVVAGVLFIVLATTAVAYFCLVTTRAFLPLADALQPVAVEDL